MEKHEYVILSCFVNTANYKENEFYSSTFGSDYITHLFFVIIGYYCIFARMKSAN